MNDITAPYEYTVRQKIEGRVRLRRTLLVLGYITYVIAIAAIVLIFLPSMFLIFDRLILATTWDTRHLNKRQKEVNNNEEE